MKEPKEMKVIDLEGNATLIVSPFLEHPDKIGIVYHHGHSQLTFVLTHSEMGRLVAAILEILPPMKGETSHE